MTNLPQELIPTTALWVVLPSGRIVRLPTCRPRFHKWRGPAPNFPVKGKTLLNYQDRPIFAELLILRLLEQCGWNGVWVSSFGGIKFLKDMPKDSSLARSRVALHDNQSALLDRIMLRSRQHGGCFDVFCWQDDQVLFCEAKKGGRDKFRFAQRKWIEGALLEGVPLDSLLVCEWSLSV
jgi:hypothetical protein